MAHCKVRIDAEDEVIWGLRRLGTQGVSFKTMMAAISRVIATRACVRKTLHVGQRAFVHWIKLVRAQNDQREEGILFSTRGERS